MENLPQIPDFGSSAKKPIISFETMIKIAIYIVIATVGFSSITSKMDTDHSDVLDLKEYNKKRDLEFDGLRLQIITCQTQISVINQQLKDMQDAK